MGGENKHCKETVAANANGHAHCGGHPRRRPRCRLGADLAGDRSGVGIAGIHPQRRQRQDDVQRRRLRVLPRHARRRSGQGGSYAPRRRARLEIPVRHLLRAEHLARPQRRHRRVERSEFRYRALEGNLALGQEPLPRFSLHLLSEHGARRHARPVRLSENLASGDGPGAPARSHVPLQPPPPGRGVEAPLPSRRDALRPIRRSRRSGTVAPTW